MAKKRWKGAGRIRRILKGLPDAMHDEIADVLTDGARDVRRIMAARAPRRTGALSRGIQAKVSRQRLTAKIGLVGPAGERRKLFYGRILDLGRKAKTVSVRRRARAMNGKRGPNQAYLMRVRGISPMRFITGRMPDVRAIINQRLNGVWERALKKVSGGSDD